MTGRSEKQLRQFLANVPHVKQILAERKRVEAQAEASAQAAHYLDQNQIGQMHELERQIGLHERDEFEMGQVDAEALAFAREKHAESQAELAARRAERAKPGGWQPSTSEITEWIAARSPKTKWQQCRPVIQIPKNSSARKEWDKKCADVDALKASIRGAEIAWLPEEEAFKKAVESIDKIAITGAPDLRGLFRLSKSHAAVRAQQGSIEWPKDYIAGDFHNAGFSLAVWLHRDALVERVRKEIAALARPDKALSVADRETKIALLKARLLEAERLEESAYLLAVKEEPSLQRRKVDMCALLQIEEAPSAPAGDLEFG
ncbi:hypothetical protein BH10PSE10_BH10PSE10_02840 [soil metagenome]